VAAVSAGIVGGDAMLDLNYAEDSHADADLNVAMNDAWELVEVQGTAEGSPFKEELLQRMVGLARQGIEQLLEAQRRAVGD
jgi:ribonuclease PH